MTIRETREAIVIKGIPLSRSKLSRKIDMPEATLIQWESNNNIPDPDKRREWEKAIEHFRKLADGNSK